MFPNFSWILTRANVKNQRLSSRQIQKCKLRKSAKGGDPDVDKDIPEFVVESGIVFHHEEDDVADEGDGVADHHCLEVDRVLRHQMNETNNIRQRSIDVSDNLQ